MELVTSQGNTLFLSLFWGQEASERVNKIKLLLICTNNYSEKFLIDKNQQNKSKREDAIHWLAQLLSPHAVNSNKVSARDLKAPRFHRIWAFLSRV